MRNTLDTFEQDVEAGPFDYDDDHDALDEYARRAKQRGHMDDNRGNELVGRRVHKRQWQMHGGW